MSDLIINWWKYFGEDKNLKIFVILENGSVKGGIPLYTNNRSYTNFLIILKYIGNSSGNLTEPFSTIEISEFMDAFLYYLFQARWWDVMVLLRVRKKVKEMLTYSNIYKKVENKIKVKSDSINASIRIDQDINRYLSTRPKRLRRYIRSCKSKAEKYGAVRLERINNNEIEKYFKLYVEYSLNSYAERGLKSAFSDRKQCLFFSKLLSSLGVKNYLDAHCLKFGDELVAISFAYRYGKGFKWILTTYNNKFQSLRPGHLLIYELLKEAIKLKDPYFDMYSGGNKFYKRQWCNQFDSLFKISIFNNNIVGLIAKYLYNFKNISHIKNQ